MTPEIEKKRRSIFEAHIRDTHKEDIAADGEKIFTPSGTGYDWHWVQQKWIVFNAALDAVEIELPLAFTHHDGSDVTRCVMDADDVVAAITATGLGLKVKP